ncbi:MAG: cell surface protein SprA [Agriterribacter sp.]
MLNLLSTEKIILFLFSFIIAVKTYSSHWPPLLSAHDTVPSKNVPAADTLKYPIRDRRTNLYTENGNRGFDLNDPSNLKDSVVYDAAEKKYYVYEKIGNIYYRTPTVLDFDEFQQYQARKQETDYFRQRADAIYNLNRSLQAPKLTATDDLFNRLFGNSAINIKPQGNVSITAGYQGQKINNPTLAENLRRSGGFDFDMAANLNVIANIGDKVKLPIAYNTQSTFDWQNQLKLEYIGKPDEIIKKIELGNTSFESKGTLIPSVQSLFGVKAQLQFGKLYVTGVLASQKSQKQSSSSQGGATVTSFTVKAGDYDENRHFLLAQYFKNRYNDAMKTLPVVNSQVQIKRIEVWVTSRTSATTNNARNVVGLTDLAEPVPYGAWGGSGNTLELPGNQSNTLYSRIVGNSSSRNPTTIVNTLTSMGLTQVQDFEKTYARKLDSTEYSYNTQLGYLSLNSTLQANEVLAVAYQYTYNGRLYQVGEFAQDVPVDSSSGTPKILFLKLLKATAARTGLPIWNLMMKNIYTLKADNGNYISTIAQTDFQLNVLYNEPGGGQKRYLPEGDQAGVPLLTLLNLDRLNSQNDPQEDGVFDYVEGYTVLSDKACVIFPVLEPFGNDLASAFSTPALKDKYLYMPLYDTIKSIAQTYTNLNRYTLKGSAKATSSSGQSTLSLNAYNVPQGSVVVTAGGVTLTEGIDYVVDYSLGTVTVINQSIINASTAVNVSYENQATYGTQQQTFMGLRLDYLANKKLTLGATMARLSERPYFSKVSYGEDPIRNTIIGGDFNYKSELHRLNRWLDRLPFYSPNGTSSITAYGEAAKLIPGHSPQIGDEGAIYIDDFESVKSAIDLRFPFINWALASTPAGATDENGNTMFPEAALYDNTDYGKNRAKLAWYNIEAVLQAKNNSSNPLKSNLDELSDPRVRAVYQNEIFPEKSTDYSQSQVTTFDLAYYPKEKGPYNYDAANIDEDGKLLNPTKRWGGLMRSIDQSDFETANIEYIECWVLDPFIKNTNSSGGQLYFNLGNISEDILKDGKKLFENGLSTPNVQASEDSSVWGKVPLNPVQVTRAFNSNSEDRAYQDVGFDGLSNQNEQTFLQPYLQKISSSFGTSSGAYRQAVTDPSSDNFMYYRDDSFDNSSTGILGRYKNFNGPEGNSPVATTSQTQAATSYPDAEDLNNDNSLNENESYFQYRVAIKPGTSSEMQVGQNFITDKKQVTVSLANGSTETQTWYQFRIPINSYTEKIGDISDFKSIQFVRIFLTGFEDSVVLRFAKMELARNQWRKYEYELDTTGAYTSLKNTGSVTFNTGTVNIEENDMRQPVVYRIPPGIERVQSLSTSGVNIQQNEQSMNLQICNLPSGETRSVFKTLSMDFRRFKKMLMFIHAESVEGQTPLTDGRINAVIRIGDDFINNFYEIKIPLKITTFGATVNTDIWRKKIIWISALMY